MWSLLNDSPRVRIHVEVGLPLADELVRRCVSEQLRERRIHAHDRAVELDLEDALERVLEQLPVALLARREGRRRAGPLGDVLHAAAHPHLAPLRIDDGHAPKVEVSLDAVRTDDAVVDPERLVRGDGPR